MTHPAKKISPALFGVALICFFMPFVSLSCEQRQITSFTGIELAIGKKIKSPSLFGQPRKEREIPSEPLAAMALLSGVVGLGTSFIKAKKSAVVSAGAGTAGFILLLMVKAKIDDAVVKQGSGIILASYGFGFWLTFLLFLSATVLNLYSLIEKDNQV
jgi:hypothetical protein